MAKSFARLILCSLLALCAAPLHAQTFYDLHARKITFTSTSGPLLLSGSADPTSSVSAPAGSIYMRTNGTLYGKTSSGTAGWYALTGASGTFTTLCAGNGTCSFTTPTKFAHFINTVTGVTGATSYAGLSISPTWTTATASWTADSYGLFVGSVVGGTQAATTTHYAGLFQANDTTTGLMAEAAAVRGEVHRNGGNVTTANPLSSYGSVTSGTATNFYGVYAHKPVLGGGGAITNVVGVVVEDQTVAGCTQCVDLSLGASGSGGWTFFSDGTATGGINQTTSTPLASTVGFNVTRTYTGNGALAANSTFASFFDMEATPTADITSADFYGVYGKANGNGTKATRTQYGIYGTASLNDTATVGTWDPVVGGGVHGIVGDASNYKSSGTVGLLSSVTAWGGHGAGPTTTKFYRFYVPSLYEYNGTMTKHVALRIDDQATLPSGAGGSVSNIGTNVAIEVDSPNTGSSTQGIMASGAPFDCVQTVTIADNGAGSNATSTITPTCGQVEITCNDTQGCDITLGETGVIWGQRVAFQCMSTSASNFADTSAVSEAAGTFACGQYDSINFRYAGANGTTGRWIEQGRSNN